MGFKFKPELSALLALIHGMSAALAYIASNGDLTVTIVLFAVSTGITAGLSYYTAGEEKEETEQ